MLPGLSILDDDGNPRNSESKAIYGNKLETCDDRTLVATVHHLLSQAFWGKLQSARPRLDFPRNEKPRLVVECRDLLVSFYWMLATDLDKGRAPMVCAHCKKFFSSARKGATYCEKQACRERGRRQLDWDRNRDKYNRKLPAKAQKGKAAATDVRSQRSAKASVKYRLIRAPLHLLSKGVANADSFNARGRTEVRDRPRDPSAIHRQEANLRLQR